MSLMDLKKWAGGDDAPAASGAPSNGNAKYPPGDDGDIAPVSIEALAKG